MKGYRVLLLLLLMMVVISTVFSQKTGKKRISIIGKVIDVKTQQPLRMVAVNIKELDLWAITNKNGEFHFDKFPMGVYHIYSFCLGYEDYLFKVKLNRDIGAYTLKMKQHTLALKQITVTAKEGRGLSSSSIIERTALNHLQASSLRDLMQLVPGQLFSNPDFSIANLIKIRSAIPESNKIGSLGTAIVLNGAPISNNANLQTTSTVRSNGISQSTMGKGVDLREISIDNIESVEVIRGIASVEYGEMTSGAVIINTRAGCSPFNVKIKVAPSNKQVFVTKGYTLGESKGFINFDVDYLNWYDDLRTISKSYKRLNTKISYSNVFFKESNPLSLNTNFSVYSTIDDDKRDKDMHRKDKEKYKSKRMSFNMYGNWALNRTWITNVEYNLKYSHSKKETYIKKLENLQGAVALANSLTSKEYKTNFLKNGYYSELKVDGEPINIFAKIKASLANKYGNVYSKTMLGIELRSEGNIGKGRIIDLNYPYSPFSKNGIRPRSFKDIPFLNRCSLFVEEKLNIPIGKTSIDVQGGIRISNIKESYEPRVNLKYQILNLKNNTLFNDLSIKAGYGINIKNPTLAYLFPDKAYFDRTSLNEYKDGKEPSQNLAIITTKLIENTSNPNLKPAVNEKTELNINFRIQKIKGVITGFYEKMKDGFSFYQNYDIMKYNTYSSRTSIDIPNQETSFIYYNTPKNNYNLEKKGIEYVLDFGKIKTLRTSIIIDGAYMYTKKTSKLENYNYPSQIWGGKSYPYVGIYYMREKMMYERFNTNVRCVTHIPEIRMLVTLTTQLIWLENFKSDIEDEIINGNREIVPTSYLDKSGNINKFTNSMRDASLYSFLVMDVNQNLYEKEEYSINHQINFRLSKEIGIRTTMSFFANNLFNYRQKIKLDRSSTYKYRNTPFFFGAELKMKF